MNIDITEDKRISWNQHIDFQKMEQITEQITPDVEVEVLRLPRNATIEDKRQILCNRIRYIAYRLDGYFSSVDANYYLEKFFGLANEDDLDRILELDTLTDIWSVITGRVMKSDVHKIEDF